MSGPLQSMAVSEFGEAHVTDSGRHWAQPQLIPWPSTTSIFIPPSLTQTHSSSLCGLSLPVLPISYFLVPDSACLSPHPMPVFFFNIHKSYFPNNAEVNAYAAALPMCSLSQAMRQTSPSGRSSGMGAMEWMLQSWRYVHGHVSCGDDKGPYQSLQAKEMSHEISCLEACSWKALTRRPLIWPYVN